MAVENENNKYNEHLIDLPIEIWDSIFQHLSEFIQLRKLRSVCRTFNSIILFNVHFRLRLLIFQMGSIYNEKNSGLAEMVHPSGIAFNMCTKNIVLVDQISSCLQELNLKTKQSIRVLGNRSWKLGELSGPGDVKIKYIAAPTLISSSSPNERFHQQSKVQIFVTEIQNHRISIFDIITDQNSLDFGNLKFYKCIKLNSTPTLDDPRAIDIYQFEHARCLSNISEIEELVLPTKNGGYNIEEHKKTTAYLNHEIRIFVCDTALHRVVVFNEDDDVIHIIHTDPNNPSINYFYKPRSVCVFKSHLKTHTNTIVNVQLNSEILMQRELEQMRIWIGDSAGRIHQFDGNWQYFGVVYTLGGSAEITSIVQYDDDIFIIASPIESHLYFIDEKGSLLVSIPLNIRRKEISVKAVCIGEDGEIIATGIDRKNPSIPGVWVWNTILPKD